MAILDDFLDIKHISYEFSIDFDRDSVDKTKNVS